MSSELKRIHSELGTKELVMAVKETFPKFSRQLLTSCRHQEDYGVRLCAEAMQVLRNHVLHEKKQPENREKANRFYFRLNDSGAQKLEELRRHFGVTSQQLFERLILSASRRLREAKRMRTCRKCFWHIESGDYFIADDPCDPYVLCPDCMEKTITNAYGDDWMQSDLLTLSNDLNFVRYTTEEDTYGN